MRTRRRTALVAVVLALLPAAAGSGAGPAAAIPLPDPSVRMIPDLLVVGALPETAAVRFDAYAEDVASLRVSLAGLPLSPPLEISGSGAQGDVDLPEPLPCGPQLLEAVWQPYGDDAGTSSTTSVVTIQCPALSLAPSELLPGQQPTEIGWAVDGFVPDSEVVLRLDGVLVGTAPTDGRGRARSTAPVEGLACGRHRVLAVDGSTPGRRTELGVPQDVEIAAGAVLTVRCPAPPDPADPADAGPALPVVRLNPVVVAAGSSTRVTGSLFARGATASLSWRLPDGGSEPAATVQVDARGGFVADVLVLVNSGQGPRELVASTPAGGTASDRALVVAGTTQPGRHGLVDRR